LVKKGFEILLIIEGEKNTPITEEKKWMSIGTTGKKNI
jgi:hypothetical protein